MTTLNTGAVKLSDVLRIIETYKVSVGNSAAGEIACEMTMANLREIRDAVRNLTPTPQADAAPSDPLRAAVESMVTMLEEGEWAEHVSTFKAPGDALASRLESAITDLHNQHQSYQQFLDETADATRPYARNALISCIAECQALSYSEDRGITVSEAESIGGVLHELRRLQNLEAEAVAIVTRDAAIAAGGAQEPIYQVMVGEKWVDSTAAEYAAVSNEKRIVYAAPVPCAALTSAYEALAAIGDFAHARSTGPTVPDALWEVRRMAYDAVSPAFAAPLPREAATVALTDEQREALEYAVEMTRRDTSWRSDDYRPVIEALLAAASNGEQA